MIRVFFAIGSVAHTPYTCSFERRRAMRGRGLGLRGMARYWIGLRASDFRLQASGFRLGRLAALEEHRHRESNRLPPNHDPRLPALGSPVPSLSPSPPLRTPPRTRRSP